MKKPKINQIWLLDRYPPVALNNFYIIKSIDWERIIFNGGFEWVTEFDKSFNFYTDIFTI